MVWMILSSGCFTSQISFTPSAKIWGVLGLHVLPVEPRL